MLVVVNVLLSSGDLGGVVRVDRSGGDDTGWRDGGGREKRRVAVDGNEEAHSTSPPQTARADRTDVEGM